MGYLKKKQTNKQTNKHELKTFVNNDILQKLIDCKNYQINITSVAITTQASLIELL